ncbi:GNAT family N-acetyltransferase [Paenibacillus sp. CAA11]|uniref:GNAT family N-acetyltransferase n=1 Tax=Paenibacillus sp. CAA11 TaxID=1532905 RepID=UPI000D374925|nr:GNAT family N-acetyltransferase [Paenibacillus sp. CAA11]AWB44935.1 GNAT family N-acetyltransferase [Paenibacillus sp. CAA11]
MSNEVCAPMLVIRECCTEDARAMTSLMRQLNYPTTLNVMKEQLAMLENDSQHSTLVAEVDGAIVGTIALEVVRTQDMAKPIAKITSLVIDEKHRKQGLGKRLVNEVESRVRRLGSSHLLVGCKADGPSVKATAFYERLGFECNGYRLSKTL